MISYLLRRIGYSFLVIIGVTMITFSLFHMVSGDPALLYAGKNASPEAIESLRIELGLHLPLHQQYFTFLKQSLSFDWGESWSNHRQITTLMSEGLGASLSLTLPAFLISIVLAIILSLLCLHYKDLWFDKAVVVLSLFLMSFSFLVYILFLQKVLAFDLNWFPIYGWDSSWSKRWMYISLPGIIYALVHIGPKTLLFRAAILNEANNDYVRTAISKGLARSRIYVLHILKNAATPILTLITSQMPSLITGSLILEAYFGIPGIGGLLIKAIHNSDFPVIKAMTVVGSFLYIFFNLLNDILAAIIDRRRDLR